MIKETYENLDISVITFDEEDVITTSGEDGLPKVKDS